MNRKWLLLLIIFFIAIIIVFGVWNLNFKNNSITENNSNNLQNSITDSVDLSTTTVTDDCVNEWEDYAKTVEQEIQETNQSLNDENRHYIAKEKIT